MNPWKLFLAIALVSFIAGVALAEPPRHFDRRARQLDNAQMDRVSAVSAGAIAIPYPNVSAPIENPPRTYGEGFSRICTAAGTKC
jgi:hypothetical protein